MTRCRKDVCCQIHRPNDCLSDSVELHPSSRDIISVIIFVPEYLILIFDIIHISHVDLGRPNPDQKQPDYITLLCEFSNTDT